MFFDEEKWLYRKKYDSSCGSEGGARWKVVLRKDVQKGKESAQVEGVHSRQVVNGKVMVNTAVLKRLKPVTKISKNKK